MVGWRGLPVNRAHTNQHLCVHLSFCALYAVFVIVTRALWSGRVRTRSLSKTHTCIQDNGGGSALEPLAPRTHTGTPLHTHSNTLGPPPPIPCTYAHKHPSTHFIQMSQKGYPDFVEILHKHCSPLSLSVRPRWV